MRKYFYGLGALIAPALVGGLFAAGCSDAKGQGLPGADICGPCGVIAEGDVGISGDARLDGFFKALGTMQTATASIQADFDANIRSLSATFDVPVAGDVNAAAVAALIAKIKLDIAANARGGIKVNYQPPKCQANVNVAVQAQAKCEVKAGCEAKVDPGELSVACEGTCSGECSGTCSGDFSCEVDAPSITCTGKCEGACTLDVAAECKGTCRGDCAGTCAAEDGQGNCAGKCDGMCKGTCELDVAAECSGKCSGKCLANPGSASCTADATCRGSCSAECKGSCEGNFRPPSVSANCEAEADCQASASAEANASLECTPPQLKVDYAFAANLSANADAQAKFTARIGELKLKGLAIVQGSARYEALLTGKVEGRTVFEPSPLAGLTASVTAMAKPSGYANFDIPAGKVACVVTAVAEAGRITNTLVSGTTASLKNQKDFVAAFSGGFST
jgi:hypothetical protein